MEIQGRRRSSNFEDRGAGSAGHAAGGLPIGLLLSIAQRLGFKGTLIVGALLGAVYLFMPDSVRQLLLGPSAGSSASAGQGSACQLSAENQSACDFSRVILASTEDVWKAQFEAQRLPNYGAEPGPYREPTLVVFSGGVQTGGCGGATSDVGPFYCPADKKLYIDPNFYGVMEKRLKAPGDFAQAYVIAHEVGHHVQNLIGSSRLSVKGETKNQVSVRVELQADCLAGVWGHTARASLAITDEDLKEALNAAHQIGDDSLGHSKESDYTHGSSAQRVRWFQRGFESGDPRNCDTFTVTRYADL
ncbi:MAG: hypothetical protein B6A08_06780 [Sorangiineae bacterium NIC37A_2]|jgi:predicted metalloprotease|nr:MAG: hypothetical protein B6A08_06780 [Sorangiineae bacterium NIC37A_2]